MLPTALHSLRDTQSIRSLDNWTIILTFTFTILHLSSLFRAKSQKVHRAESGECFTRHGELKKKLASKNVTTLAKGEWRKSVPHPSFKSPRIMFCAPLPETDRLPFVSSKMKRASSSASSANQPGPSGSIQR